MTPSKIQKLIKKSSKIKPNEYWTCSFCKFRNKNMKANNCHAINISISVILKCHVLIN